MDAGGERVCPRCEHDENPHLVVATTGDPLEGGVMLCQVKGCQCYATWALPQLGGGRDTVHVPSDDELSTMRKDMQTWT